MPPAARLVDQRSQLGAFVAGEPTVLIGCKPAARVSDMHTCPMVTGTVPHVGGPILLPFRHPCPSAGAGDKAACTGPPDTVATGETSVLIG